LPRLLVSLSSSGQTAPSYWLNPQNGVNYQVAVQTPQYRIDSVDALGNTPIIGPYAQGLTDFLSVLDAERSLYAQETEVPAAQPVRELTASN
jgi:hypothetical protein